MIIIILILKIIIIVVIAAWGKSRLRRKIRVTVHCGYDERVFVSISPSIEYVTEVWVMINNDSIQPNKKSLTQFTSALKRKENEQSMKVANYSLTPRTSRRMEETSINRTKAAEEPEIKRDRTYLKESGSFTCCRRGIAISTQQRITKNTH